MESKEMEIYSEASNYAIVKMPGRNFPGCVIQGDSLANIVRTAQQLLRLAKESRNSKMVEFAEDIFLSLSGRLDHYESVLKAHGIGLPYVEFPRDQES